MMKVVVNGNNFEALAMSADDVRPGSLVRWKESRRAYRIICLDEGDAILRNLRNPRLLEVEPAHMLVRNCWLLVPESQG